MNIELRMRGMQAMLNRLTRVEKEYRSPGALKAQLGRILVRQTKHRIEEEKAAPDGTAWRPWSREYAATRGPGDSLLVHSRRLLNSLRASVTKDGASVHSDREYAARQNFHRPFLGLSGDNRTEVKDFVEEWFAKI